ncbi:hypothetical protein EHF33_14390 [Deinococcus psychrotolerans]|uniref:Spore coat protein U/FanG domain-containing protein n=1 Tax=Deinococcus psychrotolerans TaxID=2489213 RepID=A0A3G8YFI8_9DEIO|nr:spore coat protein U domain-containing protein [Deinococcus psychrotolerans]AZI44099.1 hypothetical protein EHF33_14390 [Deinococcus psychrotolerans]
MLTRRFAHPIALLALLPSLALATMLPDPTSTPVTAQYLPSCGLSATDLDFGIYNSRVGASGMATVQVTCNTSYSVTYSGFSGQLKRGGERIGYTLTAQKVGGLGAALTLKANCLGLCDLVQTSSALTGNGSALYDRYTLVGAVPALQTAPAGTYSDTVTFTLNYNPE